MFGTHRVGHLSDLSHLLSGLFLSGQDVFSCGFTGALFGGLLAAGVVLERNVMTDLISIHKKVGVMDKKKKYE